jgi:Flp pilus assembly pilin Flp
MRPIISPIKDFVRGEDGLTAVEYAVLLAIALMVSLFVFVALDSSAQSAWKKHSGKVLPLLRCGFPGPVRRPRLS